MALWRDLQEDRVGGFVVSIAHAVDLDSLAMRNAQMMSLHLASVREGLHGLVDVRRNGLGEPRTAMQEAREEYEQVFLRAATFRKSYAIPRCELVQEA